MFLAVADLFLNLEFFLLICRLWAEEIELKEFFPFWGLASTAYLVEELSKIWIFLVTEAH